MRRKIKQSIKWILIGRQSQFAVSMLFQLVIMRILSPEDYGVYALAVSSLGFIAMFISFGFAHSIIQFQKTPGIEKSVLGVSLVQFLVYIVLTIPGFWVVGKIYGPKVSRIYLLLIFGNALSFLSLVFQFSIERDLDFKKSEIILFTAKLASVIVILALALSGWGIYSLVAGFYVKGFLEAGLYFRFSRWTYGIGWDGRVVRTVVIYAAKRFLAQGCGMAMLYIDKLILGLLVPVALVGGYERVLFIISSALGMVGQFDSRFAYSLINRIKEDTRRLGLLINKGIFMNLAFSSFLALAAFFYLRDLIVLVLGEQWEETARVIPYFSLYLLGIIPAAFIRQVFYAEKDPLHIAWGRMMEIAAFVLISLGIYRLAARGDELVPVFLMALNLGLANLVGVGYLVTILVRLKQLRTSSLGRPLVLAALSGLVGGALLFLAGLSSLVSLMVVITIYACLLWLFCRPDLLWIKQYWQV